jgi:hypothetical protein
MNNNIKNTTKNNYKQNDLNKYIIDFSKKYNNKDGFMHRYASYDFCYGYFYEHRNNPEFFSEERNIKMSCMILWSYLSSWGMIRGSSKLLQKSPAYLKILIDNFISKNENKDLWDIDVDKYTDDEIKERLKDTYKKIKEILKDVKPTKTLITKIMLGVYGNVPAFDKYFTMTFKDIFKDSNKKGYGFSSFNEDTLGLISKFYKANEAFILKESKNSKVLRFDGDVIKDCHYTGFTKNSKYTTDAEKEKDNK